MNVIKWYSVNLHITLSLQTVFSLYHNVDYKHGPICHGVDQTFYKNGHFFRSLAIKLGCFIIIELFSYITKRERLTVKFGKRKKLKFGRNPAFYGHTVSHP